ncbi:MAG: DUF3848 domain-containing protein [Acutalibacteraceae bacterium]|nr:DUF3848 domain-containing protein [Acutalibacteraceae bacterium]
MTKSTKLTQNVLNKIENELECYIEKMLEQSKENILNNAEDIFLRQSIVNIVNNITFSDTVLKFLSKQVNTLEYLVNRIEKLELYEDTFNTIYYDISNIMI